jgi:hypothetical protein
MNILTISGIVIFVVWAYVLFVRPKVLAAFPTIQTVEEKLWAGSRQILMGRVLQLGGLVVGVHDFVLSSGADPSTMLNEIAKFLPEQYRGLALAGVLFLSGIGLSWLRKVTTGPVGSSLPGESK